ncbi:hypothetical protein AMAG_00611 [Allomyces macrogynus ATCC 38327]|uniref:H/ACA ribonucleoprotein complex subunit 2 n=1 Tax=Allomyces macrogynus (strain ATCC 38327) TaxID=578462 RepID=A0A0L0RX66_ALLM3|nr:hypothetical protein AMAG_00611 [Allomyces macrogynus ATCC 38327]|eukprot:KNE54651.1 hypothetical protein AMAG_00611 [Allomyces macrogynus ATCC 38327]
MAKESKKSSKKSKSTPVEVEAAPMDVDTPATAAAGVKRFVSPIASPLADADLTKKLLKSVKKATATKGTRRGMKEVVKALRKGEKGVVILAADVTPIDVISHIPVLCEDNDVPYVFVPSKEEIGAAGSTKRPASVILISSKVEGEAKESLDSVRKEMKKLTYVK